MTIPRLNAVGFCAHYSQQGDWAFAYALKLAQARSLQLNVFHFLSDPYDPDDDTEARYTRRELTRLAADKERELRLYYDELAGEYLEVGFRLCFDDSWRELHRCLAGREFQLLVLAKPENGTLFAGRSIEGFAADFVCPVILVGPDGPEQYKLNNQASLIVDRLAIEPQPWETLGQGAGAPSFPTTQPGVS
ncbi:MAG: hypothetical protein GY838_19695 [bacterium]|nr:hypothetical protein [bacterium]